MVDSSRVARKPWLLMAGLLVVLLAVSGCGSTSTSKGSRHLDKPPDSTTADMGIGTSGSQHVDPQVLSDVIDTVFAAPGADVLREYRVYNFIENYDYTACGARVQYPIDRTWERYSQNIFPDLQLIKMKGFNNEPQSIENHNVPPGFRKKCNFRPKLLKAMPVYQTWMNLNTPWQQDVLLTVEQNPSVVALKAPFAQCLRDGSKGTGIVVSSTDPAGTFLLAVGKADYEGKVSMQDLDHRLPDLFARCGSAYFSRTAALLLAKRPAMVERNRELLEKAASQLVAMGYTP